MYRTLVALAVVIGAVVVVGTALTGGATTAMADGTAVAAQEDGSPVAIVARYPTEDGHRNETVLTAEDFESVGNATTDSRTGEAYVPVTLTDSAAENFSETLREAGFTGEGVSRCPRDWRNATNETWCLLTVLDGNVVYSAGITPGLANEIDSGSFVQDPRLRMLADNQSRAEDLQRALVGDPVTTTATSEDGTGDAGDDSEDGGGVLPAPGFTGSAAAVALVAALLVAARRRAG